MGVSLKQWGIDEFAVKLIKRKARQLIGKAGLNRSDREDLEQELAADLLALLPQYDPSRGPREAFISTIINGKAAKILRHQRAQMRHCGRETFSLNERVDDGEGGRIERSETISAEEHLDGGRRYESSDDVLARLDLEEAVSKLPADLRGLYGLLQRLSITEAAQQLGIPLSTAWDRLARLRAALLAAGVCEESYFPPELETPSGNDPQ